MIDKFRRYTEERLNEKMSRTAVLRALPDMPCEPVYVTRPELPELAEFLPYLEQIWKNKILTNGGPYHCELEKALCEYLGVQHLALFSNGTIALMTALQVAGLTGEVITTPYSFVATSHALAWNGLEPVFVDVDPDTLNIDPDKIEAAITERTTAILAVHCYGHPCDTGKIQKIADKYKLKVIYDAAHAFGVQDEGGSVLRHGDLSVLSFHATKVFHTFEGGAIICPDAATKQRIDQLKNFGFEDELTVKVAGLNGKMSEINAAFGLLQLKHVDGLLGQRRELAAVYRQALRNIKGIRCLENSGELVENGSYFPILVEESYPLTRDALNEHLKQNGIHGRRYFYPLISDFAAYNALPSAAPERLPAAAHAAERVLCLPLYPSLGAAQAERIANLIAAAGHA